MPRAPEAAAQGIFGHQEFRFVPRSPKAAALGIFGHQEFRFVPRSLDVGGWRIQRRSTTARRD